MKKTKYKNTNWKQAVLRDISRRKEKRLQWYQQVYDKPKTVEFKTKKTLNMKKFFGCPRLTVDPDLRGFTLSTYRNALAVYPVICSRADFEDEAKPVRISRENIAKLAGISPNSVDKAAEILKTFNFVDKKGNTIPFLIRNKVQIGRRRLWEYYPGFMRKDDYGQGFNNALTMSDWKGGWFPFHTCIIESGIWAELPVKSKALYMAMRAVSYFDPALYEELEGKYIPPIDPESGPLEVDRYAGRKWEVSQVLLTDLFELVCIPYNYTTQIVGKLEEHGLVERLHPKKSVFQVWLKPKKLVK